MKLRFIGTDDKLELSQGKIYDVSFDCMGNKSYIAARIYNQGVMVCGRPYESPQALAANWELPSRK